MRLFSSLLQAIEQRFPKCGSQLRLPDVLERQGLPLNLLSKRVMSLILEKHLVVLEYFPASLKILDYYLNCSFTNY